MHAMKLLDVSDLSSSTSENEDRVPLPRRQVIPPPPKPFQLNPVTVFNEGGNEEDSQEIGTFEHFGEDVGVDNHSLTVIEVDEVNLIQEMPTNVDLLGGRLSNYR